MPSMFRDHAAWPKKRSVNKDGDENWFAPVSRREIVHVSARAGDLIIWDSRLPHGNSKNLSRAPRLAFYVMMGPNPSDEERNVAIESWRTGRCVPWWRNRPGYDRIESWPSANLTPLGRRLIGLERW